jgi:hypothetical protein
VLGLNWYVPCTYIAYTCSSWNAVYIHLHTVTLVLLIICVYHWLYRQAYKHLQTCISNVQQSLCHVYIMYKHVYTMHVFHSYNVQTMYIHEHTGICMYFHVHTCSDHVYTMYILCHEQDIQKEKILQWSSFEPTFLCIAASCLNHFPTSMLVC